MLFTKVATYDQRDCLFSTATIGKRQELRVTENDSVQPIGSVPQYLCWLSFTPAFQQSAIPQDLGKLKAVAAATVLINEPD